MSSSHDRPKLMVFDDSLERRPKSSFEDGLQLRLSIDLFEVGGKCPLDKLYYKL